MKTIKYSVMLMFLAGTVYSQVPSRIDDATYLAEKARLDNMRIEFTYTPRQRKNMTQAKAIQYRNGAWRMFEMGCAGHDEALAVSVKSFLESAENCEIVCRNTANSKNPHINYHVYREMYVNFGRAVGVREIINKTGKGRIVIREKGRPYTLDVDCIGNWYGKCASDRFYYHQKGHRFNNISREQLWKWFAEGQQEVIGKWNVLN